MEEADLSKMLVPTSLSTRDNIPDDSDLNSLIIVPFMGHMAV
jgi:hypothetical protein